MNTEKSERDVIRINPSSWLAQCIYVTAFAQIRISGDGADLKGNFIGPAEIKFRVQVCKHGYLKCRGRTNKST